MFLNDNSKQLVVSFYFTSSENTDKDTKKLTSTYHLCEKNRKI